VAEVAGGSRTRSRTAHADQLSAERLQRHFGSAPPPTRALVDECTTTIVDEVESL
jgi:hypothetical protein